MSMLLDSPERILEGPEVERFEHDLHGIEMATYWSDYTSEQALFFDQTEGNLEGVYTECKSGTLGVAMIDMCELLRLTSDAVQEIYEGKPVPEDTDYRGKYFKNTEHDPDATDDPEEKTIRRELEMAAIIEAIQSGKAGPVESINKIAQRLYALRNSGYYVVLATSGLRENDKSTLEFVAKYLPDCFDAALFPRNHDGKGTLSKADALNILAEKIDLNLLETPVAVVDDMEHQIRAALDVLGTGSLREYVLLKHRFNNEVDGALIEESSLGAIEKAAKFLLQSRILLPWNTGSSTKEEDDALVPADLQSDIDELLGYLNITGSGISKEKDHQEFILNREDMYQRLAMRNLIVLSDIVMKRVVPMLDDPRFLKDASWHPAGFMVFRLGVDPVLGNLRLHIWPKGLRQKELRGFGSLPDGNWDLEIHNHSWSVNSYVITGYEDRMFERVYPVRTQNDNPTLNQQHTTGKGLYIPAPSNDEIVERGLYTLYEAVYQDGKDLLIPFDTLFRNGRIVYELSGWSRGEFMDTDLHSIDSTNKYPYFDNLHRPEIPYGRLAATLCYNGFRSVKEGPYVMSLDPEPRTYESVRRPVTVDEARLASKQLLEHPRTPEIESFRRYASMRLRHKL